MFELFYKASEDNIVLKSYGYSFKVRLLNSDILFSYRKVVFEISSIEKNSPGKNLDYINDVFMINENSMKYLRRMM
jgi:hypothetical protein